MNATSSIFSSNNGMIKMKEKTITFDEEDIYHLRMLLDRFECEACDKIYKKIKSETFKY